MIIGGCVVSEKIKESVSSPRFTFEQKAFIILQVVVVVFLICAILLFTQIFDVLWSIMD